MKTPLNNLRDLSPKSNNSDEKKYQLKELIQLKELTRYRFNLDKKLFEMKQKRKKMIGNNYKPLNNSEYISGGMAFLPRTTFYANDAFKNTNHNSKKKIVLGKEKENLNLSGRNLLDVKVRTINAELLKSYTRSLSPIVQREKINLENFHSPKRKN